ncbi:MAG TPA: enoyl-CoA hydratase/isomerase family protein [Pyrinomonadaceae bacterium]|nr:enoyl-CoA hydratase/isomerase family protein [Pyrinomonadaceae bacterium]
MTVAETSSVETEYDGELAIIRFNRPASRNSLSYDTLTNLAAVFNDISAQDKIRTIIFTGSGDVFASGADLREIAALKSDQVQARLFSERGQKIFQTIADARQLTIAAINGYCMGGALDLALACDIRIASSTAIFAHPGASLGIITGWGGTQRLPRLIGPARAAELFFTAKRFTAAEALQIGLVSSLADPILDHAIQIASEQERGGRFLRHLS